jgi:hypothetical protein
MSRQRVSPIINCVVPPWNSKALSTVFPCSPRTINRFKVLSHCTNRVQPRRQLWTPILPGELRANGSRPGWFRPIHEPSNRPFWIPREWQIAVHHRTTPLFLNQGYPLTLEQEFEFALPPDAQLLSLPPLLERTAQPLRWRVQWAKMADGVLRANFRSELMRGDLTAADTSVFQAQLEELLAALDVVPAFAHRSLSSTDTKN